MSNTLLLSFTLPDRPIFRIIQLWIAPFFSCILPSMRREWVLPLLFLPFAAFSPTRLDEVRSAKDYACADCGSDDYPLQVHHRVPQRFHGTDRKINAAALCPVCHQRWDDLADEGIVYPGITYEEAEILCFENPQLRQKIIDQFCSES